MKINAFNILLLNITFLLAFPVSMEAQKEGIKTVVIDAGHGGKDPGNLGTRRYKTQEKDIALAVALKLGAYIKELLPDVKVIYTRNSDVFVELKERAEIANRADADLFISIHCDAFNNQSVHGATTMVMGRNHDDDNLRVAMRENEVILLEDDYEERYDGFDPTKPESYIAMIMYQSAFINQSVNFAQKVQDQFRDRVSRRDRGVKQQPLMVTKMAVMPAVLIELGFLTNPSEEDFLNSDKGQSYMASAIFRAFRDYKIEMESIEKQQNKVPHTLPTETAGDEGSVGKITSTKGPEIIPGGTQNDEALPQVYYSVQIATSYNKRDMAPEHFKGVEGVDFYRDGGLYKYIVGRTGDLEIARALQEKLRNSGFPDAFVVALSNGNRISLAEARNLLE